MMELLSAAGTEVILGADLAVRWIVHSAHHRMARVCR
jgi:hypothetical protein